MSTYYDELGLSPQASAAELQAALDASYIRYRDLATSHPNPETRAEAEGNQRRVERMRQELLDPAKRTAYDASIGLSESGGLADPTAAARPAPPPPKQRPAATATTGIADLWVCPNCSTPNSEGTRFCYTCRTPLLRQCPECGEMKSLVKTGICGNCGYDYATATKRGALREEIQSLNDQLKATQNELSTASAQLQTVEQSQKGSGSALMWTILLFGLPGGLCLLSSCAAIAQGDSEGGMIVFVLAVPFLVIAGMRLNNASNKEKAAQQETTQFQQSIKDLNAKIAEIENELQGKQSALERLG